MVTFENRNLSERLRVLSWCGFWEPGLELDHPYMAKRATVGMCCALGSCRTVLRTWALYIGSGASPIGPCPQPMVLWGAGGAFRRLGPVEINSLDCVLDGDMGTLALSSLSLCSLGPVQWAGFLCCVSCHDALYTASPKHQIQGQCTETLRP